MFPMCVCGAKRMAVMIMMPAKSATDLRAVLEGFAARHAALQVAAGAASDPLQQQMLRLQQAATTGDHRRFIRCDQALHAAIVDLANVEGLKASWESAFAAQNAFRMDTIRQCWPDLDVLFESHRDMVDAIAAGLAEEAEEAAVSHLDAVWFRLAVVSGDDSLPPDPLSRACAWLAFHFCSTVRLSDLAEDVAGCSSGHLARLFRDQLGMSFSDYLIELRLQKAAQLLQRSRQPVYVIARRVGYADPSRFTTHFRRRFGQTPKAHRDKFTLPAISEAPQPVLTGIRSPMRSSS